MFDYVFDYIPAKELIKVVGLFEMTPLIEYLAQLLDKCERKHQIYHHPLQNHCPSLKSELLASLQSDTYNYL